MAKDKNIRKLTKVGGGRSYSVIIPKEIVKKLGWQERQKLVLRKRGKGVLIEDWE